MRKLVVSVAVAALVLAGCASKNTETASSVTPGASDCSTASLPTLNPDVLTIGTDKPAYPPWFVKNDPTNGKGFESASAYAIAKQLGYSTDQVKWVVEPFNKSYAPGAKDFDFDINQISITPQREKAVDFSHGYYDVNQALIALDSSPVANAKSIADLTSSKLGAQIGTTSLQYITTVIKPTQQPFVYDTTNDAKSALNVGQIDGIVVDLPTAFYITAVQIPNSKVVGQFPSTTEKPEQFGLLFEQGNPLRTCVDKAIDALHQDGTLAQIQQRWLSDATNAPVLK